MKNRFIPEAFWDRGRTIVNSGDVDIDQIDYSTKLVTATVIGINRYDVMVNENEEHDDYCSCEVFKEHKYCEHIAAVIEFLAKYGNPLEHLFEGDRQKELQRVVQPQQAIDWVQKDKQTNGLSFLADLNFIENDEFKLPALNELDEQLMLEVTVNVGTIKKNSSDLETNRMFIKLRVGSIQDKKFYTIKKVDTFLRDFTNQAVYQTGGKKQFKLTHTNFNADDGKLLDYLAGHQRDQNFENSQFDNDQYYLLAVDDFSTIIHLIEKVTFLIFKSSSDVQYETINYQTYETDNELMQAEIISSDTGYDLLIKVQFDLLLPVDGALVKDNNIYQLTTKQTIQIDDLLKQYSQSKYQDVKQLHFPMGSERALIDFVNYFKKIGSVSVPDELSVSEMESTFNLALKDDQIELSLSFDYQQSDNLESIHRDEIKEGMARQYLSKLGFMGMNDELSLNVSTGDKMYEFFSRQLPNLRENGVVNLSDDLQELSNRLNATTANISVSESDGLLSVHFALDGISENDVDSMLLQLERNQKPFWQRKDGSIMLVDESLRQVTQALAKLRLSHGDFHHGELNISATQALSVKSILNEQTEFDDNFKQLAYDLAHPDLFDYSAEQHVNAELRPYQNEGIQWLEMLNAYHFGGILADEMGLGKTVQIIAFLLNNLKDGEKNLIVAPASLIYNWQAEFEKFAPEINIKVVEGTKEVRQSMIADSQSEVLITSYNSARSDIDEYQQIGINYLILDEAQFIKNASSKTNRALRKLAPRNTFALSGTPIENRIEELWAIFEVVMPGLLPNKKEFKRMDPQEIAARVTPFIMRREKAKVLTELPDKVESNLYNELTKDQKAVYLAQLQQMQVKVKGMSGDAFVKNKIEILAGLTRLRQICDTPSLYLDEYDSDSGKLNQLSEILKQVNENNRHVLIFSQFTSMLDQIKVKLNELGLDSYLLKGDTKPKNRLEMVNQFNDGEKNIFLISLKAGGTGLNLTSADMVILVDLWWNPAVEDQATARAHRIGQKNNVDVFRLITKGTIEEQIYKLQETKRNFVDQVLSGTENKASLSEEEIREILGI